MPTPDDLKTPPVDPSPRHTGKRALRAVRWGAVVTLTAVTGGIAAVLWNRSLLKSLREAAAEPAPAPARWNDEES